MIFTTEIVQTQSLKCDLNELFRSHLEKAINTLLRTELTAFKITKNMIALVLIQVIRETVLTFDQSKPNMVN